MSELHLLHQCTSTKQKHLLIASAHNNSFNRGQFVRPSINIGFFTYRDLEQAISCSPLADVEKGMCTLNCIVTNNTNILQLLPF